MVQPAPSRTAHRAAGWGVVANRSKCANQKRQPTPNVVSDVFKPFPYGPTSLL
jgi:hypothetical protein